MLTATAVFQDVAARDPADGPRGSGPPQPQDRPHRLARPDLRAGRPAGVRTGRVARPVGAGDAQAAPLTVPQCVPSARYFNCTFAAWHPGTAGAKRSEPERSGDPAGSWYARTRAMTDVTSQTLRLLRESKGWDV